MTNTQQNGPKSMTAGGGVWQYRKLFYACHRSSARKEVCQCTIQWVYIFLGIGV